MKSATYACILVGTKGPKKNARVNKTIVNVPYKTSRKRKLSPKKRYLLVFNEREITLVRSS
jgi:hypothetical protein